MKLLISLFFLLFSFNSYSLEFPGTNPSYYGATTGGSTSWSPATFASNSYTSTSCAPVSSSWVVATVSCPTCYQTTFSGYCRSTASPTFRYVTFGVPANNTQTCPANSSKVSTNLNCLPNNGYVASNQSGSWVVVTPSSAQSSCTGGNDFNTDTGLCELSSPLMSALSAAAVGVGVVVGAIAFTLSAPFIGALATSVAFVGGLSFISLDGADIYSGNTASASSPLQVRVSPNSPVASPDIPSVTDDPNANGFVKGGAGATGSWQDNIDGSTRTTPNAQGTTSEISADKQAVTTKTPLPSGGAIVQQVKKNKTGSANPYTVTYSAPQTITFADGTSSQGVASYKKDFNSSGAPVGSPSVAVYPKQSSSGSAPVSISPPTGASSTGNGSGNSTGNGTGTGVSLSCGSLNCEATQAQILNSIQSLNNSVTATADTTGLQAGYTDGNVNSNSLQASLMQGAPDTVKNFGSFTVVQHTSECPVLTIPFNGQEYTMNSHCTMADNFRPQMIVLMNVVWGFIAFMIVLGA